MLPSFPVWTACLKHYLHAKILWPDGPPLTSSQTKYLNTSCCCGKATQDIEHTVQTHLHAFVLHSQDSRESTTGMVLRLEDPVVHAIGLNGQ